MRAFARIMYRQPEIATETDDAMTQPYTQLIAIKRWADRGLYDAVSRNLGRLTSEEASIMLRILDHIHGSIEGRQPGRDSITDFR